MAQMTKFGFHCATMTLKGKLSELSEFEKSMPVFEGSTVDSMGPADVINFFCPLGCGESLLLQRNTIGCLNTVLDEHFKTCFAKIEAEKPKNVEPVDDSLPLVFPDGQVGRCKVDPKTGQIIVTHMWMKRDDQLLEKLNELMNEFSWSATVPKDRLKQMIVELHNPPTDFSRKDLRDD